MHWWLIVQLKSSYIPIALRCEFGMRFCAYGHRLSYFLFYVLLSACMLRLELLQLLFLLSHRILFQLSSQLLSELILLFESRPHTLSQFLDLRLLHLSEASALINSTMQLALLLYLCNPYLPVKQVLRLQPLSIIQTNQSTLSIKYGFITIKASIILWQRPELIHIYCLFLAGFGLLCVCDVEESLVVHQLLVSLLLLFVHLIER
jgi:hypothetical protein